MVDAVDPRQIGSYEVLARLAEGGVGTVYLARRRGPASFSRLVAIKRLHPQFAREPDMVTMFTDEARLGARVHHANVVAILELAADEDGYYVVMEYVEGSNLGHFHWHATRGERRMPRAVALRIVLDALSGLHAAHEIEGDDGAIVNLVHRDVSPQNILLGRDGLARLGDFGIARAEALRAFETRGPALKGKLEYMSPEQVECKPVDRTTDLFAMGIVLWELLTGRRLFTAANQVTIIQRVCFDPIPGPASIDPTVSPALDRICVRALERARARRYPTAAAFAAELELAARADVGIATQREVAACMMDVLGPSLPAELGVARELARGTAKPAVLPDLGAGARGKASTYQLPASDPMIKLPEPAVHPPISDEASATEPYGKVPPRELETSAATAHYDEGIPLEIFEEARLEAAKAQARSAEGADETVVVIERTEIFRPVGTPAPPPIAVSAPGAPPPSGGASVHVPPPMSTRRAPRPPSSNVAAMAVGVALAAVLVLLGVWRLTPLRPAVRATGMVGAPPSASMTIVEPEPSSEPRVATPILDEPRPAPRPTSQVAAVPPPAKASPRPTPKAIAEPRAAAADASVPVEPPVFSDEL